MSNWECGVCGYIHKDDVAPDQCPVCEAPKKMFKEVVDSPAPVVAGTVSSATTGRRWQCSVCGYIHAGNEPPETCPVCAAPKNQFVEIDADGKKIGEASSTLAAGAPIGGAKPAKVKKPFLTVLADLILKLHLHPITVHFPNGILPAVLVFLLISMYLHVAGMELAAYFNLIFVLLTLPVVMATGFVEWQKRYKGIKSMIFITKIFCSLVVLAATSVLVFWRLIDPAVLAQGSPSRLIYLGVAAGLLAAVGIAGHLGGKLVFAARG